jgi:hypothetical protein
MNELDGLEKRIDVLLEHLATNGKKIRQQRIKIGTIDTRRLEATIRIARELIVISSMINELWESPDLVVDVNHFNH